MDNLPSLLCRDCGTLSLQDGFCPSCGSKRLRAHPEISQLAIAHIDCDAFFASVEKRDNPALKEVPVIVGGGTRGVVSTCCYLARTYGVRSAMPMFKAKALCPQAVVVKPNGAAYQLAARQIRQAFERVTPLVQPLSIDEAFLDLSGTSRLHGAAPASVLARLANEIERDVGITVSVGLSHNKFLAKLASDMDKPRGFAVIGHKDAMTVLAPLPPTSIYGVGRAFGDRLARDGLTRLEQLQRADPSALVKKYGDMGLRLYRLSRGEDYRRVSTSRPVKSISSETTFHQDIKDRPALEDHIHGLVRKISKRAKKKGVQGLTITLKLKTAGFKSFTRRTTLPEPTNLAGLIEETAFRLLRVEEPSVRTKESYRLIGVGLSGLNENTPELGYSLFSEDRTRSKKQEDAIDSLRERFGEDIIGTMRDHRLTKKKRKE